MCLGSLYVQVPLIALRCFCMHSLTQPLSQLHKLKVSVLGIDHYFQTEKIECHPDLVCGCVANTAAGCEIVQKMYGVPALSLTTMTSVDELQQLLSEALPMYFQDDAFHKSCVGE